MDILASLAEFSDRAILLSRRSSNTSAPMNAFEPSPSARAGGTTAWPAPDAPETRGLIDGAWEAVKLTLIDPGGGAAELLSVLPWHKRAEHWPDDGQVWLVLELCELIEPAVLKLKLAFFGEKRRGGEGGGKTPLVSLLIDNGDIIVLWWLTAEGRGPRETTEAPLRGGCS